MKEEKTYLQGIYEGWERGLRSASEWGPSSLNLAQEALRDALEVLLKRQLIHHEQVDPIRDTFFRLLKGRPFDRVSDSRRVPNRGSRIGNSKLSEVQVLEMRNMAAEGVQYKDIAAKFGIDRSVVSVAVRGKTWQHVGGPIAKTIKGSRKKPS